MSRSSSQQLRKSPADSRQMGSDRHPFLVQSFQREKGNYVIPEVMGICLFLQLLLSAYRVISTKKGIVEDMECIFLYMCIDGRFH